MLNDFRSCFDWLEISVDLTFSKEKAKNKPAESKLSFEPNVSLRKSEIAMLQLEDAIDLFMAGKRISVITLAGAADGIFAGLLEQQGETSAAEDTWTHIEEVRKYTGIAYAGNTTKKEAFNSFSAGYHADYFAARCLARTYLAVPPSPATAMPLAGALSGVLTRWGAGKRGAPTCQPVTAMGTAFNNPVLHSQFRNLEACIPFLTIAAGRRCSQ